MKKLLLFVAIVAIPFVCFADELVYRDAKALKQLFSSVPKSLFNNKAGVFVKDPKQIKQQYFLSMESDTKAGLNFLGVKQLSLKDVDRSLLNSIECDLIDEYLDVLVLNKYFKGGYLLVDDYFNIGYANYQGETIVEPTTGSIISLSLDGSVIGFGNSAISATGDSYIAFGTGDFRSVLNTTTNTYIIAPNRYDYIAAFIYGGSAKSMYQHYLVGKKQDNGELLFGLCNQNGEETTPCEYKSIIRLNIMKPDYNFSYTETAEQALQEEVARKQAITDLVLSIGNMTQNIIQNAIPSSANQNEQNEVINSSSNTSTQRKGDNKKPYDNPEGYQNAVRAYNNWENQLIRMETGVDVYDESNVKYIQQQMKGIRSKWEAKGYNFNKSSREN